MFYFYIFILLEINWFYVDIKEETLPTEKSDKKLKNNR